VLGSLQGGTDKCVRPGKKKPAKFAHHRNDCNWEVLAQRRKIARICDIFKVYMGEKAWKDIGDRLRRSCYLSRVDHDIEKLGAESKGQISENIPL
jgi:hypothetical protein